MKVRSAYIQLRESISKPNGMRMTEQGKYNWHNTVLDFPACNWKEITFHEAGERQDAKSSLIQNVSLITHTTKHKLFICPQITRLNDVSILNG